MQRIQPLTRVDADEALKLAMRTAPNGFVQQAFSDLYNVMVRNQQSWEAITTAILAATLSGLKFGNWPQTKEKSNG